MFCQIIIKQKRIQREKDFTKIKNIVLQNSYDIRHVLKIKKPPVDFSR